jgi:hypothetical protein
MPAGSMTRGGTHDDFSAVAEVGDECDLATIIEPQSGAVQEKFRSPQIP